MKNVKTSALRKGVEPRPKLEDRIGGTQYHKHKSTKEPLRKREFDAFHMGFGEWGSLRLCPQSFISKSCFCTLGEEEQEIPVLRGSF